MFPRVCLAFTKLRFPLSLFSKTFHVFNKEEMTQSSISLYSSITSSIGGKDIKFKKLNYFNNSDWQKELLFQKRGLSHNRYTLKGIKCTLFTEEVELCKALRIENDVSEEVVKDHCTEPLPFPRLDETLKTEQYIIQCSVAIFLSIFSIIRRFSLVLATFFSTTILLGSRPCLAAEGVFSTSLIIPRFFAYLKSIWPTIKALGGVLKNQGPWLVLLLGLSAFFSLAETSITTLWPWKVF